MKQKLFSILLITLMLSSLVTAQSTEEVPRQGITPDMKFRYALKTGYEFAEGLVYRIRNRQAEHHLIKAERRLAELRDMPDDLKEDYAEELMEEYEEELTEAENLGYLVSDLARRKMFQEKLELATQHHLDVLEDVLEKVPVQARNGIQNAIQKSEQAREKATERIRKINDAINELEE